MSRETRVECLIRRSVHWRIFRYPIDPRGNSAPHAQHYPPSYPDTAEYLLERAGWRQDGPVQAVRARRLSGSQRAAEKQEEGSWVLKSRTNSTIRESENIIKMAPGLLFVSTL